MNNTPAWIKKYWQENPAKGCVRKNSDCRGRLTKEHALTFAGRQVQELWSILDLCEFHHLGAGLDKRENRRIALSQATSEELSKYPNIKKNNGFANL